MKWHGIKSLVCVYQYTCYTKQIPSEYVDFYLTITRAHINSEFQPSKQNEMFYHWLTWMLIQCPINWKELEIVDMIFGGSYLIHGKTFKTLGNDEVNEVYTN